MTKKKPRHKKMIRPDELRHELSDMARAMGGNETKLRARVLERLKEVVENARDEAEHRLLKGASGMDCAGALSWFQDELLKVLFDFTTIHVYRATNPSTSERISIIAVGGYGRGLLAPSSDIDLLFLFPFKQTAWGESVAEYMLYMLWDLGFKVGHATRNVTECIRLSLADYTIRTSILEARHITGDETLFSELMLRFDKEIIARTGKQFIAAKLEERDQRHARAGESRYLVEPNLKEGKGGLRDLHTLFWIAKYYYRVREGQDLVDLGVLTKDECRKFSRCNAFLWTVRCHLHFLTGRGEERLSFDVQQALAERLGFVDRGRLRAVERFMKYYFLVAKDIGDLTRIICSALEIDEAKSTPALSRFFSPFARKKRLGSQKDFILVSRRINVADDEVFSRDPVNLIRFFQLADSHNVLLHPHAVKLISRSLKLVGKDLRANAEANRLFLKILTSPHDPESTLRKMNETGLLGRFVPSFGRIVALMQFNMYHHYTVDEHLLRAIGILSEIERGMLSGDHPLSHELFATIKSRKALFLAVFLHDVAKGREESHSVAGARITRRLGERLGLSKAETQMAAWLVHNHLLMSDVAQRRDLNDFKTIKDFADQVQSPERLKMLLILTVVDIRAVGPGVWNGWKGQLLRTLYHETEVLLHGGHVTRTRKERATRLRQRLVDALDSYAEPDRIWLSELHYPAYLLNVPLETQISHAAMILKARDTADPVATAFVTDAFQEVTELTIYTQDHPRLLAVITGACASAGADITGAQIYTTSNGMALDIITIQRQFETVSDEERRAKRVTDMIEKALRGEVRLPEVIRRRTRTRTRTLDTFSLQPQILVDNDMSNIFTVIEVNGLDRPGFLYDLTSALFDLSLNIGSAHIATYGERVVDVFYVKNSFGHKITDPDRQETIRQHLLGVLKPRRMARIAKAG
jgi:[protein-PII] uridylyltransferase